MGMYQRICGVLLVVFTVGECSLNMDPEVTITETVPESVGYRVRGIVAQDVTLNCFVENLPDYFNLRWQRTIFDEFGNEEPPIHISTDMDSDDVNKWSIEKPTPYSWRLRIKAFEIADEGNYTCYVQLNIDTKIEANRTVLATDPPVIIESQTSSNTIVPEGEARELTCNATGRPRPTIFWRREGNAILPSGGVIRFDPKLIIESVDYTHRGRYICEAVNEVGTTYRDIILSVQFAPKMSSDNPIVGQKAGYKRTLTCLIDANPQPQENTINLVWIKGNMALQPTGERIKTRVLQGAYEKLTFELVFDPVTQEDFGTYTCRAINSLGTAQVNIELQETSEPQPDKGITNDSRRLVATLVTIVLAALFQLVLH